MSQSGNPFQCKKLNCTYEPSNSEKLKPVMKLYPEFYHNMLFICWTHNHIHFCHSKSEECLVISRDNQNYGQCKFSLKTQTYPFPKHYHSVHNLQERQKRKQKLKFFAKSGKSLKWLILSGRKLYKLGVPTAYDYQTVISKDISDNEILVDNIIFNSALNRTFDYFITNSTVTMCKEHFQTIRHCFLELFSKSNTPYDHCESSDFKTQIKFIISMEMLGKVAPAPPLCLEDKFVKTRALRLQPKNCTERKRQRISPQNV